ncbi:MAG: NUDIX domain-containing protein [Candidatus Micrarchaeota archaeon]|nr:NUDIX domain-containing protein [Candidatus Micrarchaeota archaeon]
MKIPNYPEAIVGTLITNKKGEVLLIKSHKWKDNEYRIPGGHVEYGEKLINAVKREVKEETGLTVTNVRFLNFRESLFPSDYKRKAHFLAFQYSCRAKSSIVRLNEESKSFIWVTPSKALRMPISAYVRRNIVDFLRTQKK